MKQKTENRKPITSQLFGVPISITFKPEALAVVCDWLQKRKLLTINSPRGEAGHQPLTIKFITTPNPEMIVAAQSDPEFLKALQGADLAIPDGVGVVWALRLLGPRDKGQGTRENRSALSPQPLAFSPRLPSRLSGLDFMESLIGESAKNGWKVMLLGGKPGMAEKAAEKLQLSVLGYQLSDSSQSVVSLPVAETEKLKTDKPEAENRKQKTDNRLPIKSISGPQDISTISISDNDRLISHINSFSPDLLFVAFGHGKQEKWLNVNRYRLNVGVAMGVGGAFDQIADPSLRPPAIINSIGLGWLYRLFREPWRWKRQLNLLKFISMIINARLQQLCCKHCGQVLTHQRIN